MRTIKFKAKRLDNQEWACGYFYQENDNTYIIEDCQKESMFNRNIPYKVDPKTICQFTDVFDKNGKDIYEGDVLQRTSGVQPSIIETPYDIYGVIAFEDYSASFVMHEFNLLIAEQKVLVDVYGLFITKNIMQDFEVVGSVHDKEWQEKLNLKDNS